MFYWLLLEKNFASLHSATFISKQILCVLYYCSFSEQPIKLKIKVILFKVLFCMLISPVSGHEFL